MSTTQLPTRASGDPTKGQSKRDQWQAKFSKRWRDLRGDVRGELTNGSHYVPSNDTDTSIQIADFRDWIEHHIYADVLEPERMRSVRRGRHWTAGFVDLQYRHGIKRAIDELRRADIDVIEDRPSILMRREEHTELRREWYIDAYTYLEDAVRDTEKEVTRKYSRAAREGWSIRKTIDAINGKADGRIRKTGEYSTNLLAQSVGVQIVNEAALIVYQQAGVEAVGAEIETQPAESEQLAVHPDDHSHSHDPVIHEQLAAPQQYWQTAGDNRVCPLCQIFSGNVYQIEEIQNGSAPEPVRDSHPQCRCMLVPLNPAEEW
jgi:hypothetical protein